MDRYMIYISFIIVFGITSAIFSLICFVARKNIGLKFKSIFAKKNNKILMKYKDKSKGYHEEFTSLVNDEYIRYTPTNGESKLLPINPAHIYFDTVYQMRCVDVNDAGSYSVSGTTIAGPDGKPTPISEVDQKYMSRESADRLYMETMAVPKKNDETRKLLIYALVGIGVIVLIGIVNGFVTYKLYMAIEQLSINGVVTTAVSNVGGVI